MPVYVWRCNKCGHKHESVRSITDDSKEMCTKKKCKGECHRVLQPASFKFNTRMS